MKEYFKLLFNVIKNLVVFLICVAIFNYSTYLICAKNTFMCICGILLLITTIVSFGFYIKTLIFK